MTPPIISCLTPMIIDLLFIMKMYDQSASLGIQEVWIKGNIQFLEDDPHFMVSYGDTKYLCFRSFSRNRHFEI